MELAAAVVTGNPNLLTPAPSSSRNCPGRTGR
jgi:hypothetical protein